MSPTPPHLIPLAQHQLELIFDLIGTPNEQEIKDIVERVMRDCDIDGNSRITYNEFARVIDRIPDFTTNFRIYMM